MREEGRKRHCTANLSAEISVLDIFTPTTSRTARDHIIRYHEAIDLLQEKLPEWVRVVHYEDMIVNPAITLRTAAHLCGLPMTERPLAADG